MGNNKTEQEQRVARLSEQYRKNRNLSRPEMIKNNLVLYAVLLLSLGTVKLISIWMTYGS